MGGIKKEGMNNEIGRSLRRKDNRVEEGGKDEGEHKYM